MGVCEGAACADTHPRYHASAITNHTKEDLMIILKPQLRIHTFNAARLAFGRPRPAAQRSTSSTDHATSSDGGFVIL